MGDETGRAIVEEIDAAMFLAGMSVEQPLTATLPGFKRLLFRRKEKEAQAFRDKSYRFAANRVALGKEEQVRDIFANLIQDNSSAALPISTPELAADGMVMMIAGELASEIREAFTAVEEIRPGPELTSCSYLRACIDEALRLAPPVAAPLWREMKSESQVGGVVLPKGTDVATCLYSVHRNPAYFFNPDAFDPDRWMTGSHGGNKLELSKKAFAPFSLGSRGCIGKNLAYMELSTLLAQIVYQMDFKVAEGKLGKVGVQVAEARREDYRIWSHFTSGKEGPFLQFTKREESH
ncbi:Cytochrome P450 [Macrophomina phaseolina MS6]|uniref:Cytochrome P450 n=1 Tax=Macrophomina phaseolina (strain MS6) TaxID=1126212 RepID=K2RPP3_MACPH|nr:Cytochrome P450 [Macrophomina phaseolina MS6]